MMNSLHIIIPRINCKLHEIYQTIITIHWLFHSFFLVKKGVCRMECFKFILSRPTLQNFVLKYKLTSIIMRCIILMGQFEVL